MVAVKILMSKDTLESSNPKDIVGISISNGKINCTYNVVDLYKYLKENENVKIFVNHSRAYLLPVMATNGDFYIRSIPNKGMKDALMYLPRIVV